VAGAQRTYSTDRIAVHWDSTRCIHTGRCLIALPEVFDVRRRPWVDVGAADAAAIARAVETCPTGALRYRRLDGERGEQPRRPTFAVPIDNGPLLMMGDLHVQTPEGETIAREYRLTLCRCGKTQNQPFCDNSHLASGFRSATYASRRALAHGEDDEPSEQLRTETIITPTRDGPLRMQGRVVVVTQTGELVADADELLLCRCGRSASKPFCDSSHEGRFESRAPKPRTERRRAETPAAFEPNPQVQPGRAVERA
jgi:CDGSH-type Zn-finger protein/uncharacterized Fe-S cluster protein YjdI